MMMEEEEDRAESAGSSCPSVRSDRSKDQPPDFSAEPGPTRGQRSQSAGSSCPSVRSDRSKDLPPVFSGEPGPARVDQRSSEVPSGQSAQQHQTQLDSIFMSNFTPEVYSESTHNIFYRFRSPGPGVFQCTLTGLMFDMSQGAELLYRTAQWDEGRLQQASKMAAGPLFNIKSSEDAIHQLHLPHCIPKHALHSNGLSVVHICDGEMEILKPLNITDTHVIVEVTHLSPFGLVWEMLTSLWNQEKTILGQVLLFLRPPNPRTQMQYLNVFLLPRNIPVKEVSGKHGYSKHIPASSDCEFCEGRRYTVLCPVANRIQPTEKIFHPDFGPNYHSTFEVRFPENTEEVLITVQDQAQTEVWRWDTDLTGSSTDS